MGSDSYNEAYYKKNREAILRRSKEYYRANREAVLEYHRAYRSDDRRIVSERARSLAPKYRFKNYKSGATKRRIPFLISFDEFMVLWGKPCSYCGEPIPTIGIDRIDSKSGYSPENIVPCCPQCNRAKMAFSAKEFIAHCFRVVNFQKSGEQK